MSTLFDLLGDDNYDAEYEMREYEYNNRPNIFVRSLDDKITEYDFDFQEYDVKDFDDSEAEAFNEILRCD